MYYIIHGHEEESNPTGLGPVDTQGGTEMPDHRRLA